MKAGGAVSLQPAFDPVYMVAQLITDPFFMGIDAVADLTDFQILRIAFHPRDDKGGLKQPGLVAPPEDQVRTPEDEKAILFGFGAAMGIPAEELWHAWESKYGPQS